MNLAAVAPDTLPPEWHPQSGVLLAWPHGHSDWAEDLAAIESVYGQLCAAISHYETLLVCCWDTAHERHVRQRLSAAGADLRRVRFYIAPTNDTWLRDTAPITVVDAVGAPRLLDFQFNGWGGKYASDFDNALSRNLHRQGAFGKTPITTVDLVLEGGSIEVNGQGVLLTTERCLLAKTRNPTLSRQQIEEQLAALLGIDRVLWLKHGYLAGDDTDSHVDMLARFCDPNHICYVACTDAKDEHYGELKAMESELRAFRTPEGEPYRLTPLPWPGIKHSAEGERLPASYANFLILNGAVLVPTYDDPADGRALAALRKAFPDRKVIGIPSLALIAQRGGLHCATMQLPAGVV